MTKLYPVGLMREDHVKAMVTNFASNKGIRSEISFFNEKEFRSILNRLLDEWIDELKSDESGEVSKTILYDYVFKR